MDEETVGQAWENHGKTMKHLGQPLVSYVFLHEHRLVCYRFDRETKVFYGPIVFHMRKKVFPKCFLQNFHCKCEMSESGGSVRVGSSVGNDTLWETNIAIENGHRNSGFTQL